MTWWRNSEGLSGDVCVKGYSDQEVKAWSRHLTKGSNRKNCQDETTSVADQRSKDAVRF